MIQVVHQRRFMAERVAPVWRPDPEPVRVDDGEWEETVQRRSFSSRKSAARWIAKGALAVRRIEYGCSWLDRDDKCNCRYCADDFGSRLIERMARLILRRAS